MLVGELGEEALLRQIRRLFSSTAGNVPVGIGDDAAVTMPAAGQEVWTTDLLLEGIHFEKDWQTPRELGAKSLAVNLSDLAAMGAVPKHALSSIACTGETSVEYILEICHGIRDLAIAEGVAVIGGDTTGSTGPLVINISACGVVSEGDPVLRSGGAVGDRIFVTGFLGSAAGGLRLFQQGITDGYPELRKSLVSPKPRLTAGLRARLAGAAAMTDLSDGLATDLGHICEESSVGARILLSKLPIHHELCAAAEAFGWNPEDMALKGGEDYELLITAGPGYCEVLMSALASIPGIRLTEIGEILPAGHGISVVGNDGAETPLPGHGFDHFLRDE